MKFSLLNRCTKHVWRIVFLVLFLPMLAFGQTVGETDSPYDIDGWDSPIDSTTYYKLKIFELLTNPGGWINRNTRAIDSLFNELIVYTDTSQLVIRNDTLYFADDWVQAILDSALDVTFSTSGLVTLSGDTIYVEADTVWLAVKDSASALISDSLNNYALIDSVAQGIFDSLEARKDTFWTDLQVSMTATEVGAANAPQFSQLIDDGSGSRGVYTYLFDDSIEEDLFFEVQMPHEWIEGTDIEAHIHWTPTVTATGDSVSWGLEYVWVSTNQDMGNTAFISGNSRAAPTSDSLVAYRHYITELGTLDATGKTLSSVLLCRIFRDATASYNPDTYTEDAAILSIDFHYRRLAMEPGSREEYE